MCVYDLDDPIPKATYKGHTDVVRAISYLSAADCYVTASWDKCVAPDVYFHYRNNISLSQMFLG